MQKPKQRSHSQPDPSEITAAVAKMKESNAGAVQRLVLTDPFAEQNQAGHEQVSNNTPLNNTVPSVVDASLAQPSTNPHSHGDASYTAVVKGKDTKSMTPKAHKQGKSAGEPVDQKERGRPRQIKLPLFMRRRGSPSANRYQRSSSVPQKKRQRTLSPSKVPTQRALREPSVSNWLPFPPRSQGGIKDSSIPPQGKAG